MAFVTLKDMGSDFHRLERFDGGDFVRWQRKMHFLLETVKVYYVIVNPRPPKPGEHEEESVTKTRERLRWDQDDEICRGHILNGMSNTLFDAYHTVKTAKELWNQLERCYITEDATSKRFIISKFFDYKMVDGRSVMEQFNEIKSILDRYFQHKLALDEFIVVTSIIDKLPPSWKNFRNSLKYRKEDINLYELGTHLRIEEDLRKEEKFQSLPKQVEQKEGQRDVEENHENEVEPRRSKRMRIAKTYGPDFYMYLVEGTRTAIQNSIPIVLNVESDPRTYEEAMRSQDSSFWKEVINEEIDSIMGNGTWKLVDLPPASKSIGCKWIFKKKLRVDGSIENFKARLVAKGFSQKEGVDYFDTYAPVARIATIRVLIALASIHKLVIHQIDVKTAFLNGELDEEVYMQQPEGIYLKMQATSFSIGLTVFRILVRWGVIVMPSLWRARALVYRKTAAGTRTDRHGNKIVPRRIVPSHDGRISWNGRIESSHSRRRVPTVIIRFLATTPPTAAATAATTISNFAIGPSVTNTCPIMVLVSTPITHSNATAAATTYS
ncbi:hypothetical protein RJ639_007811 [Escallonia herrerae]|uniref:Reverse transcriptase Ty1/copia-type domain-containing protein n=1 Tax=Escallonia herrerae TaxID=1293975 RepID=A0AA89AYS1_9ASTE|nr:hypothetical protein RJ639_007811 [Escallonia herrerae]